MASFISKTLGGDRNAQLPVAPGSNNRGFNVRKTSARSSGSSESEGRGKSQRGGPGNARGNQPQLSARDIMHGKTAPTESSQIPQDDYPGLEAILKKARKIKPFEMTEEEQMKKALDSMLPLGIFPRMRELLHGRMRQDYVRAVAKWRADNWLVAVDRETEFPYARTRNIVDPRIKYGSFWLRKDYDCGLKFDGEGETISWPERLQNIRRALWIEMGDLKMKGIELGWMPTDGDKEEMEKMKAENAGLRKLFENTEFDRYEEVMKTYEVDGYTITGRYRAFKLFSKEQQKLLQEWEAEQTAEKKKTLLAHVYKHGQLIATCPKADPVIKKTQAEKEAQKKQFAKVEKEGEVIEV